MKMKFVLLALVSMLSIQASALDFRTQDNVNYVVGMFGFLTEKEKNTCFKYICRYAQKQGDGTCKWVVKEMNIMVLNLTSLGADKVKTMKCVEYVEEELTAYPNPRV